MRLLYDHDDDAPDAHTKVRRPFHDIGLAISAASKTRVNALMARRLRVGRRSAGGVRLMFRRRRRR
jgi:hypothetical protein